MINPVPYETTFEVKDRCLCLHVQRAARVLARMFDEALKPYGLTNGQFSLLMSLNRPAPPRMSDLAPLLGMDRTTLTAALKVLERQGLAMSVPDEHDGRIRRPSLTDAGRKRLAAALPVWRKTHDALDADLEKLQTGDLRSQLVALARC